MCERERLRALPSRGLVLALLAVQAAACTTWRPSTQPPRELVEEARPQQIRVVSASGVATSIRNPRIVNDSIAVVSGVCRRLTSSREPRYACPTRGVIALSDVRTIEVRGAAQGRTMLLLAPVAAIGLLAGLYAGASP